MFELPVISVLCMCDDDNHRRIDCVHKSPTLEVEHVITVPFLWLWYILFSKCHQNFRFARRYTIGLANGIGTFEHQHEFSSLKDNFYGTFRCNLQIKWKISRQQLNDSIAEIWRHILFVVAGGGGNVVHISVHVIDTGNSGNLFNSSCMHFNQEFMKDTIDFETNDIKLITCVSSSTCYSMYHS